MKLTLLALLSLVSVTCMGTQASDVKPWLGYLDVLGFSRINLPKVWPFHVWTTTRLNITTRPRDTPKISSRKGRSNTTGRASSIMGRANSITRTSIVASTLKESVSSSTVTAAAPSSSTTVSSTTHAWSSEEHCSGCHAPLLNWGGNFNFSTQDVKYPTTTAGVQQLVKECKGKIRPVGTRHSFSQIANTDDTLICLVHMNSFLGVDPTVPSVTVQAGITYTDLIPYLQSKGMALPILASLAEISIAGAIQTGSHGSGSGIGNLATQVLALQMVLADGSVVQYDKNDIEFAAAGVGLGALGIITQVTLKLQPTYNLAINVFQNMSVSVLENNFDDIMNSGYAVNLFSTFASPGVLDQVHIARKVEGNSTNQYANLTQLYGASAATVQLSPIADAAPAYMIPQMGIVGPWYERLTAYAFGVSGSEGEQIQTEYYVAYHDFLPALKALEPLASEMKAILYVALFRITEADEFWMSPQYNKRTMGIHFSWKPELDEVMALLPKIEAALAPFKPIPHWGKLFTLEPEQYLPVMPKYAAWRAKVEELDPTHKFRNKFLEEKIFIA